jgi:putative hemolysin
LYKGVRPAAGKIRLGSRNQIKLAMEIFILIILTFLNGFFALSEISIISVKKSRIEQKARQGSKNAQIVLDLIKEPEGFLSAVQVGITLIGIVSGAYGGAALSDDVRTFLLGIPFLAAYADTLALVLVIGTITYFSIVIGELIPKTIALGNAESIALFVAPIIKVFTKLTMPLVKILSGSTNVVIKLFGIRESAEETISEDEIRQIIKTAGKQGILAKEESELHQNIFHYTEQKAKNLFTHRREVEWIDINDSLEDIQALIRNSAHSKFPVADGEFDKVIGILNTKDFYESVVSGTQSLRDIIKPPIYVSETMYAQGILNLFKKQKQYLGVVVDEFGSPEGLITLHDILEAIVGDLPDVDETNEPEVIKRDDHSYLVNGSITIYDLNRELRRELIKRGSDNYATLAGFMIHFLNRLPATGEKLEHNGYEMEVVDMDGIKIDKVLIKKVTPPVVQP